MRHPYQCLEGGFGRAGIDGFGGVLIRGRPVFRAFAGEEVDRARYYPEDAEFLLEMSERVEHWEVVDDR